MLIRKVHCSKSLADIPKKRKSYNDVYMNTVLGFLSLSLLYKLTNLIQILLMIRLTVVYYF